MNENHKEQLRTALGDLEQGRYYSGMNALRDVLASLEAPDTTEPEPAPDEEAPAEPTPEEPDEEVVVSEPSSFEEEYSSSSDESSEY